LTTLFHYEENETLMRKTLWTLNVGNYAPELCYLTYPLLLAYAQKIGADFRIINERRFAEMPLEYEKLQIFYLGRGNDWNAYVDSDALVFPDMFDVTERIPKDTVAHYANDHASNRWRYDDFFRRDGRDIGSCNWFTAASDWCIDLWHPLEDLSLAQAVQNIRPIVAERKAGISAEHLIDDYVLSRNIARFGLKFKSVAQIQKESSDPGQYFWHRHTIPLGQKVAEMREAMRTLKLDWLPQCGDWLGEFGAHTTGANTIMAPIHTNDVPCNGIAPQDGEPCARPMDHAGEHSNVGPYRNTPRHLARRSRA
jgi:hypothetical protein